MKQSKKDPIQAGVLVLDTAFPRVAGDVGSAKTFTTPPLYEVVSGASVARIVSGIAINNHMIESFQRAAQTLETRGADFITTSCGFLSSIQSALEDAVSVPVISSSLQLLPKLAASAENSVAVLTFDADELNERHLAGVDVTAASLHGIPKTHELHRVVSTDAAMLNVKQVGKEVAEWIKTLMTQTPNTTHIVIECTNLVPYKAIIEQASQRRVYDLFDAIVLVTGLDRAMLVREPFRPRSVA